MLLASLIQVPLVGGYRGVHAYVRSVDQVRGPYRAVAGNVSVDLTRLICHPNERIGLHASTGFGTVTLLVPFDAHVIASGRTGLGTVYLGRRSPGSVDVTDRATLEPRFGDGATIVADLQAGLGDIEVIRQGSVGLKKHMIEACG
jgi:hypothetical protein